MVLQNFLVLPDGEPTIIHMVDHEIQARGIVDPLTRRAKTINVLVFEVDEVNGVAVSTTWSITAERLASNFKAFLDGKTYVDRLWTVTPRGTSFMREFEVTSTPIAR